MMSKPDTYKNSNASQTVSVASVSKPIVGRYVNDPTAPYGVRFVESSKA
jgi:hypothetical protein